MPEQVTAFIDSKGYLWRTASQALASDCQFRLSEVDASLSNASIVQHAEKVVEILSAYLASAKLSKTLKVVAEQSGGLFAPKPTGRFYIVEEGPHETFKALEFCDAEGRVQFFDSREAAQAAVAKLNK